MARVTSVVGQSRSSIRVLTELSISAQAPLDRPKRTRCRVLPSRPTTCPTRSSCCAMRWLAATISLKVSAILPAMPSWSPAMRTEKSPTRIAWSAFSKSSRSALSFWLGSDNAACDPLVTGAVSPIGCISAGIVVLRAGLLKRVVRRLPR